MNALQMLSNIVRKVIVISLYAASVIYILISVSFPVFLVRYIQESQREAGSNVEGFWSLFPSAVSESWSLGMLWAGFVFALFFGVLILSAKKFWPQYQSSETVA